MHQQYKIYIVPLIENYRVTKLKTGVYLYRQVPVQTTVHFSDTLSVCLPVVCSHHYMCRWLLTQQFYWSQSQHH